MAELSRRTGLEYNALARWVKGKILPSLDVVAKVATVCNVTMDWLVLGIEHQPASLWEFLSDVAPPAAVERGVKQIVLNGYRADRAFWVEAQRAIENKHGPAAAAEIARRTVEVSRAPIERPAA